MLSEKSKEKRKESLDNEQNINAQRERFYATLQKSTRDDNDKIPGNNPLEKLIFFISNN